MSKAEQRQNDMGSDDMGSDDMEGNIEFDEMDVGSTWKTTTTWRRAT